MMTKHPSLSLPFVAPAALEPVEKMPPNKRCWCQSGRKFKDCHRDRERQAPINIHELSEKMRARLQSGQCSHPSAGPTVCGPIVISAHTVQKQGGLSAIAEKGHVFTTRPTLDDLIKHEGKPPLRLLGINQASTFPGFCNKHDTQLFQYIEGKQFPLDSRAAFLFAFRAIAYETFAKEAQLDTLAMQRKMDSGQPLWKQKLIQESIYPVEWGVRIGLKDITGWKGKYDSLLLQNLSTDFHFYAVRFNAILPIVVACAFHPEYGFDGTPLQRLGRRGAEFEHVCFNVTSDAAGTVAIFGWIGAVDGPAAQFVDSFRQLPHARKADAAVRATFELSDNVYIRPSWWDGLTSLQRAAFERRISSGTTTNERPANALVDTGTAYSAAAVVDEASG
jgi:hypothetical protein